MRTHLHVVAFAALCLVISASKGTAEELPQTGRPPLKILFLGNSITRHTPLASIGWTGDWGMAASAPEKDYASLLVARFAKHSGTKPQVRVRNIADFERGHATYDLELGLKEELALRADYIIVAIGENVPALPSAEEKKAFDTAFRQLLAKLKKSNDECVIAVRSSFWANETKDSIMKAACDDIGGTYVDISALGKVEHNYARSERKIEHAGVANHPGDEGMAAIADEIWKALEQRKKR